MATSPIAFAPKKLEDLVLPHEVNVDPRTGSLVATVAIPVTSARAGFQPSLALAYSSSARNSTYGLGWSLNGTPSVSLSLRGGQPRYDDQDSYAFAGVELLASLDGTQERVLDAGDHWVHVLRARVDTDFTRFEKWTHKRTRAVHFRARDRENTLSIFGRAEDGSTRISDPGDETRTFEWLLEAQYDADGNAIVYEYDRENSEGLDSQRSFEYRRAVGSLAQRYLVRIRYGNRAPLGPDSAPPDESSWMFSVLFDYGQRAEAALEEPVPYSTSTPWPARPDPFSNYRAGFEVRTYRLCHGVFMFHHFPNALAESATLVGGLRLQYRRAAAGCTLERIDCVGYRQDMPARSIPPLRLEYSELAMGDSFEAAPLQTVENVPAGLADSGYQLVDLTGEGLPGILVQDEHAWYYKENRGGGRFAAQRVVLRKPSAQVGSYAFSDFDGDGNLDLVVLEGRSAGHYEYDRSAQEWRSFRPFSESPHTRPFDGHTQLIDLDGDGRADIVTVESDRVVWHRSKGRDGFEPAVELARGRSSRETATIGAQAELDAYFADMTGDGRPDQVRIRSGCVEYWPQLGNGRFGQRVVMENAPVFDGAFDPTRLRLVDLDGSGTSDLIYIGKGEIRYWFNACGNQFVEGGRIGGLPTIDNLDSISITDFLGDGTLCLVWSSSHVLCGTTPLRYLRLTGATRPRLLQQVDNSMGRTTTVSYGHSARHYLRDLALGRGWNTKLPSHTIVVDRLDAVDHIADTLISRRLEYHDGYYDGSERAFRGFGCVDQIDSELHSLSSSESGELTSRPCFTRTWFHNGAVGSEPGRANDYYAGDELAYRLPDHRIHGLEELSPSEYLQAYRALAGQVVRTEVYGVEPSGKRGAHPFQVSSARYCLRRLAPASERHLDACFTLYQTEAITYLYEQDPMDPRVLHTFTHDVDAFGNPTLSSNVAYPRRSARRTDIDAQAQLELGVTRSSWFNEDSLVRYEVGVPTETRSFDVTGITPSAGAPEAPVLTAETLEAALDEALTAERILRFHEQPSSGFQARLVNVQRAYYWNDERTAALALGDVGARTLAHHSEAACYPEDALETALGGHADRTMLLEQGLFRVAEGHYWQASPTRHYEVAEYFSLLAAEVRTLWFEGRQIDATASFGYDPDWLQLVRTTDPVGNTTAAAIDYHRCAPFRIVDTNDNVREVRYDALGIAVAATEYGTALSSSERVEALGNAPLAGHVARTGTVGDVLRSPNEFLQNASTVFHYALDTWDGPTPIPPHGVTLVRTGYLHDGEGGATPGEVLVQVKYSDGFGRTVQTRERVEPGPAFHRASDGRLRYDPASSFSERYRVSGHTVYNAKQEVVRVFEPFFSTTHEFETDAELQSFGVSTVTSYDALGRVVSVAYPNLTHSRTERTPWELREYDANDTVEESAWAALRRGRADSDPEKLALQHTLPHAGTPLRAHLDPLGRDVVMVKDGGGDGLRTTVTHRDHAGNPVLFEDARELPAFRYVRDMLGRVIHEHSIDAGSTWSLIDSGNRAIHVWDGRGVHERVEYDAVDRPVTVHVSGLGLDQVTERLVYGDHPSVADGAARNLRGRLHVHYDQAGIQRIRRAEPGGAVLELERQLAEDYHAEPDWERVDAVPLEAESFLTRARYDALGRVHWQHTADGVERRFQYALGGGLARLSFSNADGTWSDETLVDQTTHNARGQRTSARVGPALIDYEYDDTTYRLQRLYSRRSGSDGRVYQDVHYTFDPVGNLIRTSDLAQRPGGPWARRLPDSVQPTCTFRYDAFYQLRAATGRVHLALVHGDYDPRRASPPDLMKSTRQTSLDDLSQIRHYTREYDYDPAGNLRGLQHTTHARPGSSEDRERSWHVDYWVSDTSNRSLAAVRSDGSALGDGDALFDANGNLTAMDHLRQLSWSYRNRLSRAVIIPRDAEQADDAQYYVYASDGTRVRRADETVEHGRVVVRERIYLEGCELVRERVGERPSTVRTLSHFGDGGQRIATLHQPRGPAGEGPRLHYSLPNHLGSVALELDASGGVLSYEEYFPFGGSAFIAGRLARDVAFKEYRYCGKQRDDATGLYYYGQRYLVPWLGRWLSPDPVGPDDGLNLYQFVHNNPVRYVDPIGLNGEEWLRIPVHIQRITEEQNERLGWEPGVLHAILEGVEPTGDGRIPRAVMFNSMAMAPEAERVMYVYDPEGEYLSPGVQRSGGTRLRIAEDPETGDIQYFILVPGDFYDDLIEVDEVPATAEESRPGSGSEREATGEAEQARAGVPDGVGNMSSPRETDGSGRSASGSPDGTSVYENRSDAPEPDYLTMDVPGSNGTPPEEPPNPVVEFIGYMFWFAAGVVTALVMAIVELAFMVIDAVALVSLGIYYGLTDDLVDWDCLSAYGRLWESNPRDAGSLLLDGIVETPDRIADAILFGRPFELGQEAINVLMLVDGANGLARGVTRVGGRVRAAMVSPTARMLAVDAAIEAEAAAAAQAAAGAETAAGVEVAATAEVAGGEASAVSAAELAPAEAAETAGGAAAAADPPLGDLADWNWSDALAQDRAALGHDEGMLARGRTDIPGMENVEYRGQSRRAGGSTLSPGEQPANPQNATVQFGGEGSPHAEGDVANQVIVDIEARISAGELTEADLTGRRVHIAVEQYPCACCRARHAGARVRPLQAGKVAWMSNLVQLSHWYPHLDVLVTFPGGRMLLRAGEMVERIGFPNTKNIYL